MIDSSKLYEAISTGCTDELYDSIEYMDESAKEEALDKVAEITTAITLDDIAEVLQDALDRIESRIEDWDRVYEDELSVADKAEINQRIDTLSDFADRLKGLIDDTLI